MARSRFAVALLVAVVVGAATSCSASDTPQSETTSPAAPATSTGPAVLTPVVADVVAAPIPVTGSDGLVHLAYELRLTNTGSQPATIASFQVTGDGRTLVDLSGDALMPWFQALGGGPKTGTVLAPGQQGLVWIDATVNRPDDVPGSLGHVLTVDFPQATSLVPGRLTENVANTKVDTREAVRIRSPLDGPRWLDGTGCCTVSAHRAAVLPINGEMLTAERFAIDFVQLDEQGRIFVGDKTQLSSYEYYGAPVRAVSDGKVIAVVGDLSEQVPGASPQGLPLDQYGGNHVVQDIGNGRFAFYAHLQPGSVDDISVGQDLRAGDQVGLLGNSGNTDAPHLHFHVMDGPDPLASNGVPFEFDSFQLDARMTGDSVDAATAGAPVVDEPGAQTGERTDAMPLYLDVVTFPGG
ncbi:MULTISPECIES: M23 family metallopeptidase [unclassified Rhodococcus (in: high G+C Gram-positive bacteria)]|uniref:M23 family metallopeptidase n=1 Tax=unclassified Rhodococcus (in: high G+C Gram-positive bacteria) TaxID=192944 RepID=UPI0016397B7E|nr:MULTISPECIES: M23 family metallopeptidase [unclassified Rhodococcus (in: high G+C Gram-positive bacteria)]MBC2639325.1 M23 family metallopeptidase [Rhodococcus sp. 3A]MBC2895930.1 M23 family metallopeptidase [Rhodococcus sp. 4CII]